MLCKICSATVDIFAQEMILGRHRITYYRCNSCDFIFTEDPFWLEEAYTRAITESDVGLVGRNLKLAVKSQAIISKWFDPSKCFLDFAGGYGLLVRLMRDAGYDFHWYDQYCQNLFAKGFEADVSENSRYELVTAFEVFEHMRDPLPEIERMTHYSQNILFSTEIIPLNAPPPGSWWYYGINHGQHISLYSLKSLKLIADELSLNFYTDGHSLHLLTGKELPQLLFKVSTYGIVAELLRMFFHRKTLLLEDAKTLGCNL
jgi:hypothetical protein